MHRSSCQSIRLSSCSLSYVHQTHSYSVHVSDTAGRKVATQLPLVVCDIENKLNDPERTENWCGLKTEDIMEMAAAG